MAQAQPLQGVSIARYESRSSTTSSYTVYAVVVQLPVRSWTVYRRYSEFIRLDKNLAASAGPSTGGEPGGAGKPAPRALPPRERAREWKKTFSGLLSLASGDAGSADDEELWLKERMHALELYLKAIVMDPDARWRESEAFRMFIEWPMNVKMVTTTPASSQTPARVSATTTRTKASMPGALPAGAPGTRALGTAAAETPRAPAQETERTRALDNAQLFQSQTDAMDEQDEQLLNLAAILRRQRQMGEAINQELGEHTELLTQLDTEVESTQSKLARADQKMDRFDGGSAKRKAGIGRKF